MKQKSCKIFVGEQGRKGSNAAYQQVRTFTERACRVSSEPTCADALITS